MFRASGTTILGPGGTIDDIEAATLKRRRTSQVPGRCVRSWLQHLSTKSQTPFPNPMASALSGFSGRLPSITTNISSSILMPSAPNGRTPVTTSYMAIPKAWISPSLDTCGVWRLNFDGYMSSGAMYGGVPPPMFIPRLEMRKEFVWAGAEKPKSERQARGGVAFVIRMLDCHQ